MVEMAFVSSADRAVKTSRWKWIVLISCFFSKMFVQGIRKSFGVLLPALEREFESKVWLLGSTVAMFCAVGDFLGPIAGALARQFTCRVIAMAGGVLLCLGVTLASQMTDVYHFAACLILFCGPGLSFLTDIPFAVLAKYFTNSDYGLANGFAFLGASTALIIVGPLTQILVEIYGWRGAVLLLGGIFFHATIFGALLKSPPASESSDKNGYLFLKGEDKTKTNKKRNYFTWMSNCFESAMNSLHLSIFKEPIFYVIMIVTSTIRFTHMGWVIYLVPNAESKGIEPLRATLVAVVGGVGDATGKIIPGLILRKEILKSRIVWICGMVTLSTSLVMDILVKSSFVSMLLLAFFQGLGLGSTHSLNNVVFKDVFGPERLVNAMGWIRCFSGVARLLGGFVVGWIYSSTLRYDYGFVTLGCVQCFGMLVLIAGSSLVTKKRTSTKYTITRHTHARGQLCGFW